MDRRDRKYKNGGEYWKDLVYENKSEYINGDGIICNG